MSQRFSALPIVLAALVLATTAASSTAVASTHGSGDESSTYVVSARDGLGCC
jgi:hypothetical protein